MQISVNIQGDKVVISNLQGLISDYPKAAQRGMSRSAKGIHRLAMDFLSGAGGISKKQILVGPVRRTGFTKKTGERVGFKLFRGAGSYPVPVRTGNLRRLLDFVEPGQSKSSSGQTFTADPMSAIVYNSAEYARVIHAGTGSSAKFGPRQYLYDALDQFNQGHRIAENIAEEIAVDIAKRGLA